MQTRHFPRDFLFFTLFHFGIYIYIYVYITIRDFVLFSPPPPLLPFFHGRRFVPRYFFLFSSHHDRYIFAALQPRSKYPAILQVAFIDLWNSSAKPGRKMFFRVTRRGEEESGGRIMYGWRHCRASRFGDKCSEENGGIGVVIGFMEKRCVIIWFQSRIFQVILHVVLVCFSR